MRLNKILLNKLKQTVLLKWRMAIYKVVTFTILTFTYQAFAMAQQKLVLSSQEGYLAKICKVIVSEALTTIDIDVEYANFPGKLASHMANISDTDGEVCRIKKINLGLKNLIRIEPSLTTLEANVLTIDKKIEVKLNGWEQLKPYHIGIHAGHFYSANGTKDFSNVSATAKDVNLIRQLINGLIDFAVMVKPDAMYAIEKLRSTNVVGVRDVIILKPAISKQPVYLYLNKKNKYLIPRITKAIKNIVETGRAQVIYNKVISELQKGNADTLLMFSHEN